MRKLSAMIAASALLFATSSAAATVSLQFNGSGQLTGATGISVRDARFDGVLSYTTYDVQFLEGTCSALFGGCDQASDFVMTDGGDGLQAYYAAQALLDQVFTGSYDLTPTLTAGCGSPFFCEALIPYAADYGYFTSTSAFNGIGDADTVASGLRSNDFNSTDGPVAFDNTNVFALFSLSAEPAVPEPSTWAMMLLGFAGIGTALRRRRKLPTLKTASI